MYILATKPSAKDSYSEYEGFDEFESLSELKEYLADLQAESMTDAAMGGYSVELNELASQHHIYKQVPMDEADVKELEESIINALPKQIKDLARKLSKRHLKVVA
jgi:hypothetical protein